MAEVKRSAENDIQIVKDGDYLTINKNGGEIYQIRRAGDGITWGVKITGHRFIEDTLLRALVTFAKELGIQPYELS